MQSNLEKWRLRYYPRRRAKQRKLYRAYKKAGVCWKCKVGDIANPGGAWCLECIESERLRRKSDA